MILSAQNINIKYDKNLIINDQSFNIKGGCINVFLGKNGCGKSTVFKSLCKQLKPSSGRILLNKNDIKNINTKEFAKKVGILFQENITPNDITVKNLISYGRFPHLSIYSDLSEDDYKMIENAMILTNTNKIISTSY
jgi:iron complex transport system ATP-binding protein